MTTPALTEPSAVVADGGAPVEGGSRKGADLALAADPAPSECLSEARYRLLRHAAVYFRSSDISVLSSLSPTKRRKKHNRATQDSQKHRRRMAVFATTQGGTSESDPGPIEGRPAGDRAALNTCFSFESQFTIS